MEEGGEHCFEKGEEEVERTKKWDCFGDRPNGRHMHVDVCSIGTVGGRLRADLCGANDSWGRSEPFGWDDCGAVNYLMRFALMASHDQAYEIESH